MNVPTRPNRPVATVETVFDIFEFIRNTGHATLREIADELEMSKSTAHRHLRTLEYHGFVSRVEGRFKLGFAFLDYGVYVREESRLFQAGQETIDQLAEDTDGKVWLVGLENGKTVHLYSATGSRNLPTNARVGQRNLLHLSAVGKPILASLPDEKVKDILEIYGLPPLTENTITDEEELFRELESIRERGYAFNREESVIGLKAVGAAVQDSNGDPIGAVSISGSANRMKGDFFEEELPQELLAAVNEIELNLRYSDVPS